MNTKFVILLTTFVISVFFTANAQVTIGSGIAPEKAALLDLKSQESVTEGGATTGENGGGLLLSRVELKDKNDLTPFLSKGSLSDQDYEKLKKNHKGLLVYNLATKDGFSEGVYFWDGEIWKRDEYTTPWYKSGTTVPSVNNTDDSYMMAKIGIGTNNPQAQLHVEGDMIIDNVDELDDGKQLVVAADGKVGTAKVIEDEDFSKQTRLFFIGSTETYIIKGDELANFNLGAKYILPFVAGDSQTSVGDIGFFNGAQRSVVVKKDGFYDISATLGIAPDMDDSGLDAYLAANIEMKRGAADWVSVAGNRTVVVMTPGGILLVIPIPSSVIELKANDQLRLVVYRTKNADGVMEGDTMGVYLNGINIRGSFGNYSMAIKVSKL